MNDHDSAAWAEHHHLLSDGIARLIRDMAAAFDRLQHIQFDAPWTRPAPQRAVRRR